MLYKYGKLCLSFGSFLYLFFFSFLYHFMGVFNFNNYSTRSSWIRDNYSQLGATLKLGNIRVIFPNFQNCARVAKTI